MQRLCVDNLASTMGVLLTGQVIDRSLHVSFCFSVTMPVSVDQCV